MFPGSCLAILAFQSAGLQVRFLTGVFSKGVRADDFPMGAVMLYGLVTVWDRLPRGVEDACDPLNQSRRQPTTCWVSCLSS